MDELLANVIQDHNVKIFADNPEIEDVISALIGTEIINDDKSTFIIDIGKLVRTFNVWNELLPSVTPYYAVKCNSDTVLLKVLAAKGCKFDCASFGEVSKLLEITDAENLLLAHPIKTTKTLSYARAVDVDMMTFDSAQELLKLKLYHPEAKLLMRLKVDDSQSVCKFSCKFGVPEEDITELLRLAKSLDLQVIGFSFHVGSLCNDPAMYKLAIDQCLRAIETAGEHGLCADVIDIGGGFMSDTFAEAADIIRPIVEAHSNIKWISEPGRLFANDCATIVVTVVGKKELVKNGEKEFVYYINDGVYASFCSKIFDHATIKLTPFNERSGQTYRSKVFGNTCDSIDFLEECMLPNLAIGEKLYMMNVGAYTMAAASCFNGFELANRVYILT